MYVCIYIYIYIIPTHIISRIIDRYIYIYIIHDHSPYHSWTNSPQQVQRHLWRPSGGLGLWQVWTHGHRGGSHQDPKGAQGPWRDPRDPRDGTVAGWPRDEGTKGHGICWYATNINKHIEPHIKKCVVYEFIMYFHVYCILPIGITIYNVNLGCMGLEMFLAPKLWDFFRGEMMWHGTWDMGYNANPGWD